MGNTSLSYSDGLGPLIFKSRWCHVNEPESNEARAKKSRFSRDLTLAQLEFVTFPNMELLLFLLGLNSHMFLLIGTLFRGGNIPPPSPTCHRFCHLLFGKSQHPFCKYLAAAVDFLLFRDPALLRVNLISLKSQLLAKHPEVAFESWQEVMAWKFDIPQNEPVFTKEVRTPTSYVPNEVFWKR